MKTKYIVTSLLCLLAACAQSKGDKGDGVVAMDANDISNFSAAICPAGTFLREVDASTVKLGQVVQAIVFASGSGKCALESNVNDHWYDSGGREWFFQAGSGRCVENNSIWKYDAHNSHTQAGKVFSQFSNYDGTDSVALNGTFDLSGTYLKSHAGVHVLNCL